MTRARGSSLAKVSMAIVAALAALAAQPAAAQDDVSVSESAPGSHHRDFRFELGLVAGGQYFNEKHSLGRSTEDPIELSPRNSGTAGLQFAAHANDWLTFELEGLATRTTTRDEAYALWLFQFGGHIVLHPFTAGRVQPFLLGGYGFIASMVDGDEGPKDDQDGVLRGGLGTRIALTDRVGLRLDARVQTPLAFASNILSIGEETDYGGPDFQGLISLYFNVGEVKPQLLEKVIVKEAPPDPDPDRDGIITRADRCPTVPEDADGFEDDDGCPEADNDHDGIADLADKCPLRPETKNDIDDDDGCPETDEDNDGFLGSRDQCPAEAETKNGYKDKDGCPDELPVEVKRYTGVIQGINFKTKSAVLLKNSFPLLDRAVKVLKDNADIRLEIAGHTDSRGKGDFNRDLSQRRAEAVREYFVKQGIAAERIVAVGYGMDKPIASNKTEKGRSQNRRTEFSVLTN